MYACSIFNAFLLEIVCHSSSISEDIAKDFCPAMARRIVCKLQLGIALLKILHVEAMLTTSANNQPSCLYLI